MSSASTHQKLASGPIPPPESGKKRARYTSVACNECKRRKIKCNGERPCERCGNQGLDCVYASHDFQDSEEYRRMTTQIDSLQDQVSQLFSIVTGLRQELADRPGQGGRGGQSGVGMGAGEADSLLSEAVNLAIGPSYEAGLRQSIEQANEIDVDMSRNGRIEFVQHQETDHSDPLLSMNRRDATRLLSIYTTQIHPLYPLIQTEAVLWRLDMIYQFRDAAERSGLPQIMANAEPGGEEPMGVEDDAAMVIKMVMAVAAKSESLMANPLADQLYANVQDIYRRRGYPPPPPTPDEEDDEASTTARHRRWIQNGLRLRLLQALWHFQLGEDEHVLIEISQARRAFDRELQSGRFAGTEATGYVRLGEVIFSMYWLFVVLLKPAPRMDLSVDRRPPVQLPDDFAQDSEGTLRGPLFEYAKLCSLVAFGFESPDEYLGILETVRPPWSQESSVDFVHRWQTHFADGLRSLATLRLGVLSNKSPQERVVQSSVYLLANYLRLLICQYKTTHGSWGKSNSGTGGSNPNVTGAGVISSVSGGSGMGSPLGLSGSSACLGPAGEYLTSARFAQDSVTVLWNVHRTAAATWQVHLELYNRFLVQAAEWLYALLGGRVLPLTADVRVALERALALFEAYAAAWPRATAVLQKLRESRQHGVLGEPY